ncbi:MAG: porin family protein [Hyphomicrobiales bacterium]|nr:porin family protein [Hyphomicrobiales bacterium]MCP4998589.1 porin family protein [Hyphomicrobiales bacterium]
MICRLITYPCCQRAEYRYSDYNTHNGGVLGLGILNVDPSTHTFHTTLNYRFNGGPSARTVAPMVHDWSGFKVGAAVGGGALVQDVDLFSSFVSFNGIGAEGFLGEVNVGYDFEVGNRFVVGVVGAARISNIETELNIFGFTATAEADYGFDALLRAGMKFGDRSLGYVIGGYTYQNFEFNAGGFSTNWDSNGFTIGSGMEVAFSDRVTGYAEYRYSEYEREDFGTGTLFDLNPSSHTFRVGAKMKLF